jgi:phage tail-like protein
MDVNNTNFHLLFGRPDWLSSPLPGLDWDLSDNTLTLARKLFLFPPRKDELPPDFSRRRGAAQDRFGNWYWIGDDRSEIRFLGTASTAAEHFWSAADEVRRCAARPASAAFQACPPPAVPPAVVMQGLSVTTEHYLVVGVTGVGPTSPRGLLIFDLYGGGAPTVALWPEAVAFEPFDMAPTPDGGVWILDRTNQRYWRMDRRFQLTEPARLPDPPRVEELFQPAGGPKRFRPQPLTAEIGDDSAMPLGDADPVSIEALPDGTVVVLDTPNTPAAFPYSIVRRYHFGDPQAQIVSMEHALAGYLDTSDGATPSDAISAFDLAFVADAQATGTAVSGTLFVVGHDGNQSFAFRLSAGAGFTLDINPIYLPMRLFGGKALVAAGGLAYYDFDERWVALAEQPRPRYALQSTIVLSAGSAFDGREPRCVWHRLFLDACIPAGASVTVESRAANDPNFLAAQTWDAEPSPYLRQDGIELPYYPQPASLTSDQAGTWELLFQNAVGRYLQIRLTLSGTGRNTPRLRALRVYYPRFSYLKQYLPAAYRDDASSASFLDRYLANPEGFYTDLEGKIASVQEIFDTRTIPVEYLDWLASWFGATLDLAWDEARRRLFLANAPQIFRERGTIAGLIRAIRLSLDACPDQSLFTTPVTNAFAITPQRFSVRVVESYLTRSAPAVDFGDSSDVETPGTVAASTWTPSQGAAPLAQQYQGFLAGVYSGIAALNAAWGSSYSSFGDILLPAIQPAGAQGADWKTFVTSSLGFTYAIIAAGDAPLYRDFLSRQYPQAADMNTAYRLTGAAALSSFAEVQAKLWDGRLVQSLPASGRFLQDWILFASVVVPAARTAHRFTVLVPVAVQDSLDVQVNKREVVRRVTEIEKPAHTSFDVKLYFALFRVGAARLGADTVLGDSSRFVALLLGSSSLAASYLGFTEPWNVEGRRVVGRDTVAGSRYSQ